MLYMVKHNLKNDMLKCFNSMWEITVGKDVEMGPKILEEQGED